MAYRMRWRLILLYIVVAVIVFALIYYVVLGAPCAHTDEVKAGDGRFKRVAQDRAALVRLDSGSKRRIDHRKPAEIHLVSGREDHVVRPDSVAAGQGDVHGSVRDPDAGDGTSLVQGHLAEDPISQPLGAPRFRVYHHRPILRRLRQTVEQIRQMLEDPVEPAGRDARVRRSHAFDERAFTEPIAWQPIDGATRYEMHVRPCLVKQRGILDRALPAADHDDPISPEPV